jgi:hypothetical protein
MREPTHDITPDGTYVFEVQLDDGARAVVEILPEEVDEVAGPLSSPQPTAEERQRRYRVARLLAEPELRRQLDDTAKGAPGGSAQPAGRPASSDGKSSR